MRSSSEIFQIPVDFVPYYANGDTDHLTDFDLNEFTTFEEELSRECHHWIMDLPAEDQQKYFSAGNDVQGLMGNDVYDLKITFYYKD